MEVLTWEELQSCELKEPDWLCDPYIARQGVSLLWGKFSTCKSPLTWHLAKGVGDGTHFFGLPCKQGRVVYIEVDMPKNGAVPRIKHLQAAPNVWWAFSKPLSLGVSGMPREQEEELKELQSEVDPDLVIIDSLRKIHSLDDKDSKTPTLVYGYFQYLFPNAALLFIHHERKSSQDPRMNYIGSEAFSGSQHWADDIQVGLQMESYSGKRETHRLWHRKAQLSAKMRPLPLKWDGKTLTSPLFDDLLCTYEGLNEGLEGAELDRVVSQKREIGLTLARQRRLAIEAGKFPGSRGFLERDLGEEEEE